MKKRRSNASPRAVDLRRRADEQAEKHPDLYGDVSNSARLLHELQVHKIELEMQNEELREARMEAEENLRRYSELYDFAPVGYLSLDRGGVIRQLNLAAAELLEYNRVGVVGQAIASFIVAEDHGAFWAFLVRIFSRTDTQRCELALRRRVGGPHAMYVEGRIDASGQICRTVIVDITERKQTEASLQLAALAYKHSSEAMMITEANGAIVDINPAFTTITGYTRCEILGKNPIFDSIDEDAVLSQSMRRAVDRDGHWRGEITVRHKCGGLFIDRLSINTIFTEGGLPYRRIGLFSDVTEQKRSERLIWQQANFDKLTGLANRNLLYDRLDLEIKRAHRDGLPLALIFIDLDRFKEVNDTLGHAVGDLLLREAAQRLKGCVRDADMIARLGGDEFTILLSELDRRDGSVERVTGDVLKVLSEPFQLAGEMIYISASAGITFYPDDGTEVSDLLKNADQAMYSSKNEGRSRYTYFKPSMQGIAVARRSMISDIHTALTGHQFAVYYQPIVDLMTGDVRKAEALIRWHHPVHGLIRPDRFISLAEETHMIARIEDWVLREVVGQVMRWQSMSYAVPQISINSSPARFRDNGLAEQWPQQILEARSCCDIAIEITEQLLLDCNTAITEKLLKLRSAGVHLALDDFGTGYSSLTYLRKFKVDYIKIDQSFIGNLTPQSNEMVLCEAIIAMAHKLGISVIAEGVETNVQRRLLEAIGCDYGQGFLFSKPLPTAMFEASFITSKRAEPIK